MILEDPFDDPPDLPVPDRSPEPTKEQLDVSTLPLVDTLERNRADSVHRSLYAQGSRRMTGNKVILQSLKMINSSSTQRSSECFRLNGLKCEVSIKLSLSFYFFPIPLFPSHHMHTGRYVTESLWLP